MTGKWHCQPYVNFDQCRLNSSVFCFFFNIWIILVYSVNILGVYFFFPFSISVNSVCTIYHNAMSPQSSVCEKIMELLGQNKIDHHQRQVAILSQDSFYRELTPEQKAKALKGQFNFDHPGMNTYSCTLTGLLSHMLLASQKWLSWKLSGEPLKPDTLAFSSWNLSWVMCWFQGGQVSQWYAFKIINAFQL